jgi:hypothetical protein
MYYNPLFLQTETVQHAVFFPSIFCPFVGVLQKMYAVAVCCVQANVLGAKHQQQH